MSVRHLPRDILRYIRAAAYYPSMRIKAVSAERHTLPGNLIVSLTSYPPRFPMLHWTLESLLNQKCKPDKIVLWIAHDDRKHLPRRIEALAERGVTIRECEDFRSFKKIVPALREYGDAFIAICDDDMLYPPDWLGRLVAGFSHAGECVYQLGRRLTLGADGYPVPYAEWPGIRHGERASSVALPLGCAGVLYPPRFFPQSAMNSDAFTRLCPNADDLWLYWQFVMAGRVAKNVPRAKILHAPHTQGCGLRHANDSGGGNDRQIAALMDAYGLPWLNSHSRPNQPVEAADFLWPTPPNSIKDGSPH